MNLDFWQAYVVTGFLTALSTLGVGFFVYCQKPKSAIHQAFMLLAFAIFQWSFCTALQGMQRELSIALFWGRVCHIGVLFIPVLFYYFALKVTSRANDVLLRGGFFSAIVLCLAMLFTPYFIPTERRNAGVNFIAYAGPLYIIIVAFFVFFIVASLKLFFSTIRQSTGARKKHLEYFFWSSVIGYGIGVVNFFPTYGVLIPPYPYSAACGAIYFLILGYAILKHQLFDIEVVIKRGLVFTLLFGAVYALVATVIYLIGLLTLGAAEDWMPPLSIALAMLIYEPLKKVLEQGTHQFLFQKKRQSVSLIQSLSAGLRIEEGSGRMNFERITMLIANEMELKSCVYYGVTGDRLHLFAGSRGASAEWSGAEDIIHRFIKNQNISLILPPLSLEERSPLEQTLHQLRVDAIVPIKNQNEALGVLLLGEKKSEEPYNIDDEAVLRFLQSELEMQLLSAKLLAESIRAGLELSQRSKMSALRHLARGVHHEVRNPLHTMSLFASTTLDEIDKGYARKYSGEEWRSEVLGRVNSMTQETIRIQETLSRFAQFARPGDERPQALVLTDEFEKFLALMREGQKLDGVEIRTEVYEGIKVMATENIIQETLFSLFMNALDAMNGRGRIILKACFGSDKDVCVSVKDDGPGIPQHLLKKIFEADFTTKANAGAVGFSLSTIKHRMELLGGYIEVKSVEGQGAEFILHFRPAL